MTSAAICGSGTLMRSDVLACIAHLRAFAIMLAGDHRRADDLVCDTIEQTFTEVNRLPSEVDLKVQMFAVLRGLHYGALGSSTERSARQRESSSSGEEGPEPDQLLRVFGRLRDERREALILTIASGLSYQQAAEVCGCRIAVIKSRVSEAWLELSRTLASPCRETNWATSYLPMERGCDAGGFHELAASPSESETGQSQSRLSSERLRLENRNGVDPIGPAATSRGSKQ